MRSFYLMAESVKQEIVSGVVVDGLGYSGSIPGPTLIFHEGDWVEITVENRLHEKTALHIHGLVKPNEMDGQPDLEPTPFIYPGEAFTYRFRIREPGTFFYHSSQVEQMQRGMVGAVVSLPAPGRSVDWRYLEQDIVLLMQEWDLPQEKRGEISKGVLQPDPFSQTFNFFTFNGKAFPDSPPIEVTEGRAIRLRLVNPSMSAHSIHLHGHNLEIAAIDGFAHYGILDTVDVAPGNRWEVEFYADNPGIWPLVGSKPLHRTNNFQAPGGMIIPVKYRKAV